MFINRILIKLAYELTREYLRSKTIDLHLNLKLKTYIKLFRGIPVLSSNTETVLSGVLNY